MDDRSVSVPLMIRSDDIQFVEEDNDTVSENEPSSGVSIVLPTSSRAENVYTEVTVREKDVEHLEVPRSPRCASTISRSTSTESEIVIAMLERSPNSRRRNNHEYEKLSVSSATSKKSGDKVPDVIALRKRTDPSEASSSRRHEIKGEDDETILEGLRQVVRKCTNPDPLKRPASFDIFESLSCFGEKS